jgi:hypothetical protein
MYNSPLLYSLNHAPPDEILKIYILYRLIGETVKEMFVPSLKYVDVTQTVPCVVTCNT